MRKFVLGCQLFKGIITIIQNWIQFLCCVSYSVAINFKISFRNNSMKNISYETIKS